MLESNRAVDDFDHDLDPSTSTIAKMESDFKNPYLFTGRRWEPEVGLYQYRHRYYKPEWGRFVQRDPMGY